MRFCPLGLPLATDGTQEPFRNRVNVLRNRDNLFSITSQQFPPKVYTNAVTQLRSYAVA